MIQQVVILGNVGQAPELKYTQGGMAVLDVSVATSLWRKQAGGEYGGVTQWWRVKLFGKQAEAMAKKSIPRGAKVFASGEFELRTWTNKQGVEKSSLELLANNFKILVDQAANTYEESPKSKQPNFSDPIATAVDEDLPF